MSKSENFSDFKTDNEFILSSYKKIKINVYKTLSSATSVQSSFIIVNRVWITLKVRIIEFMMYMILWLIK